MIAGPAVHLTMVAYVARFNALKNQIINFLRNIQDPVDSILGEHALASASFGLDSLLNFYDIMDSNVVLTAIQLHTTYIDV